MADASTLSAPAPAGAHPSVPAPPPNAWVALTHALDLDAPADTAFAGLLTTVIALTGASAARLCLAIPPNLPDYQHTVGDFAAADRHTTLPLTASGRTVGTLDLAAADPAQLPAVASAIATLLSLVLDNAALREAQSASRDQAAALSQELANARQVQRTLLPQDSAGPFPLHGIIVSVTALAGLLRLHSQPPRQIFGAS